MRAHRAEQPPGREHSDPSRLWAVCSRIGADSGSVRSELSRLGAGPTGAEYARGREHLERSRLGAGRTYSAAARGVVRAGPGRREGGRTLWTLRLGFSPIRSRSPLAQNARDCRMEAGLLWFCNWSTLGVCAALKLPQIYAQLAARSARGISLPSLLLELVG